MIYECQDPYRYCRTCQADNAQQRAEQAHQQEKEQCLEQVKYDIRHAAGKELVYPLHGLFPLVQFTGKVLFIIGDRKVQQLIDEPVITLQCLRYFQSG